MEFSEVFYYLGVLASVFLFLLLAPVLAVLNNFAASLFFYLYKKTHLNDPYLTVNKRKFWEWPVTILMKIWRFHGRVWHGFEIQGLENIPDDEAAILVSYHTYAPIDAAYLLSNIYLFKKRKVIAIVDRMALQLPGYRSFVEALEHQTGTVESCVEMLSEKKELLLIYPGGTREAMLSNQNYEVIWPERAGFGKVSFAAKNKIIPIFTSNVREISQPLTCCKEYFAKQYLTKKVAYTPIIGWFPVKLNFMLKSFLCCVDLTDRAFIGKPVEYSVGASVEEIVQLTKQSMEELIKQHQKIPGSVPRALMERLTG